MKKNKLPQAVVFDMDGIIFDTERLVMDCWVEAGNRRGLTGVEAIFTECIGVNAVLTKQIALKHLGEDFPYDALCAEKSELFHQKMERDGLPVKTGVRETLETLKQMKIPLGLASSSRLGAVEEELEMAGLLHYFKVVMGGDQLKRSKPEPDIYLMTCEKLEADPAKCIAVEDSYNGILSAYRAGMCPVMIPDMLPPTQEMREKSAVILQDMNGLAGWITEQYGNHRRNNV